MATRDDGKTRALAASRTLNPHPEKVTDPAFGPGGFFDPADLVQVKYEMVRTAAVWGAAGPGRRSLRGRPSPASVWGAAAAAPPLPGAGTPQAESGPPAGLRWPSWLDNFLDRWSRPSFFLVSDSGRLPAEAVRSVKPAGNTAWGAASAGQRHGWRALSSRWA
jgi:hypothetical protein